MKVDELVETYIKIRSELARITAEYEEKTAKYKEAQAKIEAALLRQFDQMGVTTMRTPAGTAYIATRSSASVGDWDSFKTFLEEQEDPFVFVERRVSKAAVEQFKQAHDGDLPPGINWREERVVNFRKA